MRALRAAATVFLCLALAAAVSACGGTTRHRRGHSGTLTIYTSLPFRGAYQNDALSIYDAEQLALGQTGGVVNGFRVRLAPLDDASPATNAADPLRITENARAAALDPTTIAYIGELAPGTSPYSIPLLSQAGVLQVSPGDTATNLTGGTFARVVPPDSAEADAQLKLMQKSGVKRLFLVKDRSTYGSVIATAAVQDAPAFGIDVVDPPGRYLGTSTAPLVRAIAHAKVAALLYAGEAGAEVGPLWNAVSNAALTLKKFGSVDIANGASWAQTTMAARTNTYLSAPGIPLHELPRAGSQFVSEFQAKYGSHVSWASGIFGYVAMSGVLDALYGLDRRGANERERVASAFLLTRDLPSALGSYDINGGQTTFDSYCFTEYDRFGQPDPCAV